MKVSAIILAAGIGSRMKLGYNKMLYKIDTKTIIEKTVDTFLNNDKIDQIVLVVNPEEITTMQTMFNNERISIVSGGEERYLSVYNGLHHIFNDYVLIHDGARCYLSDELLNTIINATIVNDAVSLGVPSKDTVHICDNDGNVIDTLDRNHTYIAQTPQGFKLSLILQAYNELFKANDTTPTDDVMIVNKYTDTTIKMIDSSYNNIKITTLEDL